MTSAVVFLGPTLNLADATRILSAEYRPPVCQGDVYKAVSRNARVVAIVDGYFQTQPAVWHKEILFALSQGVHVFGGASMGALRAAELAPFGMVGVGEVFESFYSRRLSRDDEVAIEHGPAELGFAACSIALVDIRATLKAAVATGFIDDRLAQALVDIACDLFYPDRTYENLIESAANAGLPRGDLSILADWLKSSSVSIKRLDAEKMLKHVAAFIAMDPAPFVPTFRFEESVLWDNMVARIENPILRSLS